MTPPLRWLRAAAIAIALAGVVDPSVTTTGHERPEVALMADGRLPDPALVDRVAQVLEKRFAVRRGPSFGAAAVVSVGRQLPPACARGTAPAFVVWPEPRTPFVAIEAIDAPARAHLQSRVPLAVHVRTLAARGRSVVVTLESGGVAVDQATRDISRDDDRQVIPLGLAGAVAAGTAAVMVRAEISGAPANAARADLGIEFQDQRWAVLVFDRRPSWMSTFVRRALESDPRFVVTSRVGMSRGASIEAGRPPASLSALPDLSLFDVVLAGAPAELTGDDVAGLERFMRERGGAVVLLPDEPAEGRPYQRLTAGRWRLAERADAVGDPPASAFFSPEAGTSPSVVWRAPVGAGRLIVSTALDAWRYRDASAASFDKYWRLAIAEAADATPSALEVMPEKRVLAPGESTRALVRTGPSGSTDIIKVRPGTASGPERVEVTRSGLRADTTVLVVPGAQHPTPDQRALVDAWTTSQSGQVLAESRLSELVPALDRALAPPPQPTTWFPMRSAWWIAPFAALLGAEWWTRRRRGLR